MKQATDYDGAWKEAIEIYLRPILELCFPEISACIDWKAGVEFLDQELQEVVRDADTGKMRVDKLIKVKRLDGAFEWVLLHFEVQSQPDRSLSRRMYQYYHRLEDRYGRQVVSLVLLADARSNWKPVAYEAGLWGCRLRFEFPSCKLAELGDEDSLGNSSNPAALIVAAHLAAQRTSGDADVRLRSKAKLARSLYERSYSKKDIQELFRLIDWLLRLPEALEVEFREELFKLEKEKRMPYITSIERFGRKEGRKQGRKQGRLEGRRDASIKLVLPLLSRRFPELKDQELELVGRLPLSKLESLGEVLLDFHSVDEFREWLRDQ